MPGIRTCPEQNFYGGKEAFSEGEKAAHIFFAVLKGMFCKNFKARNFYPIVSKPFKRFRHFQRFLRLLRMRLLRRNYTTYVVPSVSGD